LIAFITFVIVGVFLGSFDDAVLATLMSMAVDIEVNGEVLGGTPSFHDKLKEIERQMHENLTINRIVVHQAHGQDQPLMNNNGYANNTSHEVNQKSGNNMYEGGAEF